jgi:hypothetical protein
MSTKCQQKELKIPRMHGIHEFDIRNIREKESANHKI